MCIVLSIYKITLFIAPSLQILSNIPTIHVLMYCHLYIFIKLPR